MKHIVRLGNYKSFSTQCQECGCEFIFTRDEYTCRAINIYHDAYGVVCPHCDHFIPEKDTRKSIGWEEKP